jgi:teichuronic acid biosynthesis glycosyltransferase TuaC
MNILTFTALYPNAAQPDHGVFVENRLRQLASGSPIRATCASPRSA